MIAEQTELIKALRLIIDEKTSHEKALQEPVSYTHLDVYKRQHLQSVNFHNLHLLGRTT